SLAATTRLHARHQPLADAPGTNCERVHRNPDASGQLAAAFDLLLARLGVVLDDQLALLRSQRLETAIEAIETVFPIGAFVGLVAAGMARPVRYPGFVQRN